MNNTSHFNPAAAPVSQNSMQAFASLNPVANFSSIPSAQNQSSQSQVPARLPQPAVAPSLPVPGPQTVSNTMSTPSNTAPSAAALAVTATAALVASTESPDIARMKVVNQEKALLMSRKIVDHERRLKTESEQLDVYRRELALLQRDLNKEVVILQGEIDAEVRDVSALESEFRELEKQYLEKKALLARKRERKDMLTSHLATIISHHELRRADRLNELMSRMSSSSSVAGAASTAQPNSFSGF
jgi:hypothetical protein